MTSALRVSRCLRLWHGTAGRPTARDWIALSPEERARAHRFMDPAEAGHYVYAHATVRRIIAGLLHCSAEAIRFGREQCPGCGSGEHGRPRIVAPPAVLGFNHSRSHATWLLAVATEGQRVGADVEEIRPLSAFQGLIDTCLAPDERIYVTQDTDPVRRLRRFYRCWVRKEAVFKAVGTGLAGGLARLDVRPYEAGSAVITVGGPGSGRFLVHDVPLGPRLAAAVAEELIAGWTELSRDSSERTGPEFIN
ncbi:4'-phosphopantetheinyl transferase family protein [Streptomyces olivochromogenes]|uniref:4'-phosphopantetheinyl transferase family protein n=1 Tax=Streptomyces olivochromogenes TaxID=1963 RepID=UPI001F398850|nr:4'-phosphopantetheinyl transferase superfamily protein [Streptomyces olivochromogenes]MCF3131682.1 4'-phosphopantetheinyl transferase superfamily protein [Streptomyces olivochromogenes]